LASYHAISATSRAIIGLLEDACPKTEFDKAEFKLYQASNYENPIAEGISVLLYRVTVNTTLRNLPPRVAPDGTRYRPSLPLDLQYLLTAWAADTERQQRLLGWAMRTLEDTTILPAAILNKYIDMPDTFRPEEAVELVCDSLSVQDLTAVWDKLKPKYQTSVTYVARMISIDSEIKLTEAELVQTRGFDMRKKVLP
jgi:hypothetical protein